MFIIGIDPSGPTNTKDTACVVFRKEVDHLNLHSTHFEMTDFDIVALVTELALDTAVAVGIDAPLSYNPGGGDRPSDRHLRQRLKDDGGSATAVMTPTMTRMVYLTLRGMSLARMLDDKAQIVEVHPGAALALGQAPHEAVRRFKKEPAARQILLNWLAERGLRDVNYQPNPTDHFVAACASAMATWNWTRNRNSWFYPAQPPFHPYDFAC